MSAKSLLKERRILTENSFLDLVIWELTEPVPGSKHNYKYRLAFIIDGECILRYDNESGKGDHKHIMETEVSFTFSSLPQLVNDFMDDVEQWRKDDEYSND
ncbi:MAG: DUF6516 family protein [Thiolinea sp.]